jgi:Fur family ferric uptake transcriptional regulator
MSSATVESVLEQLRGLGSRVTPARRVVIEMLVDADGHLGAEELAALVKRRHPDVHLSTVYRTLDTLEELGIVQHTHLGHGPAVYHVGVTHQHLVCEECGKVVDVPVELLDDLRASLRRRYGFQLHIGHFALLGRCDEHRVKRSRRR